MLQWLRNPFSLSTFWCMFNDKISPVSDKKAVDCSDSKLCWSASDSFVEVYLRSRIFFNFSEDPRRSFELLFWVEWSLERCFLLFRTSETGGLALLGVEEPQALVVSVSPKWKNVRLEHISSAPGTNSVYTFCFCIPSFIRWVRQPNRRW